MENNRMNIFNFRLNTGGREKEITFTPQLLET